MEDTSIKVTESTQAALATVKQSGIVQNYVMPVARYSRQKYDQSPMVIKVALVSFGALSAIPVTCFLGFMAMITLGCLIVGGLAFTIVEVNGGSLDCAKRFLSAILSSLHMRQSMAVGLIFCISRCVHPPLKPSIHFI